MPEDVFFNVGVTTSVFIFETGIPQDKNEFFDCDFCIYESGGNGPGGERCSTFLLQRVDTPGIFSKQQNPRMERILDAPCGGITGLTYFS